jgi:hypothetical protein
MESEKIKIVIMDKEEFDAYFELVQAAIKLLRKLEERSQRESRKLERNK